jgi:tripartite-type tricarboxylate transporter receptor subunit TctC
MNTLRRRVLELAIGAAALPMGSLTAGAQTHPSRPVSLIVFVPAGGTPDIIARLIGQSMSWRLGQPVVIDNRPGGGGNVAQRHVRQRVV